MAYLRNPSFELGKNFWNPINHASGVTFSVGPSSSPPPVTGSNIANFVTLIAGGSIGQDTPPITAASVSCFAYVDTNTGADGALNIWNVTTGDVSSTPFTIQNPGTWQLVQNTLDIGGTPDVELRVEIYCNQQGGSLSIDYVNLF